MPSEVRPAEVRVAIWEYRDAEGRRRRAYFGNVVELTEDEYTRAERAGVFAARPVSVVEDSAAPDGDAGAAELGEGEGEGEGGEQQDPGGDADPGELQRPKLAAVKDLWVEYAVSRGMDRARAEDMTKAELVTMFGQD